VHWRRFDSDLVLLDLRGGEYYGLNEVASALFERVARGEDLSQIVTALLRVFDVEPGRLEEDLERTIGDLVQRGVLLTETASP
jgi:hypothetical protein